MENIVLKPVPTGQHKLPQLRYPYNALEPVISEEILKIHHDKHHAKYVEDLNHAEINAQNMRKSKFYDIVNLIERQLAFNGSGHILHSIYWTIMTYTDKGGSPGNLTSSMINLYFGSYDYFKEQFTQAATKVLGSGWCILGYNPFFRHLEIMQVENHENMTQWGIMPILVCDVWEHAYYPEYKNKRDEYVKSWWRVVNWEEVENRLVAAIQQTAQIM